MRCTCASGCSVEQTANKDNVQLPKQASNTIPLTVTALPNKINALSICVQAVQMMTNRVAFTSSARWSKMPRLL